ncbi:LPS-assembly protein LptD [Spirochaetia bacterium 38H-sp]|uniref:LPS-assembly protein LptD n=1 Tax=Rarispira pelagica TaxID=3141764 RepID=A0ABU9UFC2_9SPIR
MRRFILLVLILLVSFYVVAQESGGDSSAVSDQSLAESTVQRDIETSSYFQLVEWCKRLGLADTGTRDTLEARLLSYYGIVPQEKPVSNVENRVIELKKAGYALYSSFSEIDETYVLLKNALLFFEDEQGEHSISADIILYNISSDTLAAYGHVVYVKKRGGEEADRFEGNTLYIRIEDTSGLFIEGASYKKSNAGDEELLFATVAKSARRNIVDKDEVIRSSNVFITSSQGNPPYYGIQADNLWLYGGSDWIISNAILKVGIIPVLYIPFFFYAGDEMVFNPVFGFDDRRGAFFTSTTYFIGHKKTSSQDNTFSFMSTGDDANYIYERHGIFYHKIPVINPPENTSDYLKIMLDYYTGLGYFTGVDASLGSLKPFSSLSFFVGIAKSRTLFSSGTGYTPYFLENGSLVDNPDSGYFASMELPFRYRIKTAAKLNAIGADMEWNISLFSDPFVAIDFLDRKEDISWKKLLGVDSSSVDSSSSSTSSESDSTSSSSSSSSVSEETTMNWIVKANWANLPDLSPYFMWNNLSISNIFSWSAKSRSDVNSASPERMFFIPVSISLPSVSSGITGNIFSYPFSSQMQKDTADVNSELFAPWDEDISADRDLVNSEKEGSLSETETTAPYSLQLKDWLFLQDIYSSMWDSDNYRPLSFSSSYTITPVWNSIYYYDTSDISKPDDIKWGLSYAKYSFSSRFMLSNNINIYDQFFSVASNTDTTLTRYFMSRLGDSLSDTQWLAIRDPILMQNNLTITETVTSTLKPLYFITPFRNTSLSHSLVAVLLDEDVSSVSNNGRPVYEYKTVEWNKTYIKSHKLTASLGLDLLDTSHSFSSSYVLPPLDESLALSLTDTIYAWSQSSTLNYIKDNNDWTFSSFTFNQKINLYDNNIQASQLIKILPLEEDNNSWRLELHTLSLKLYYLTFSSTWQYTYPYTFGGYGIGWIQGTSKDFLFSNFTAKLNLNSDSMYFWKNRMGLRLGASSTYSINPIRVTETKLDFIFTMSFFIREFISLDISSSSLNRAAYRYIPGLPEKVGMSWINPLSDIFSSFNIFDNETREQALFKLQKIDISIVHDLRDWDLSFTYTGLPEIKEENGLLKTVWDSSFSILLSWKAIKEIESKVKYSDNQFSY